MSPPSKLLIKTAGARGQAGVEELSQQTAPAGAKVEVEFLNRKRLLLDYHDFPQQQWRRGGGVSCTCVRVL